MQYNYIIVIGSEEMKAKNVSVRTRDGVVHGAYSIERLLDEFHNKFYGYQ
jgi:threonyl-tRNA synthetase